MSRIRILVCSALACMLAGSPRMLAAENNPLVGKWKFSGQGYVDGNGHNWCDVIMEIYFDQNNKTVITAPQTTFIPPRPGTRTTTPAYYAVYGDKIYVSGTNGLLEGPFFTMIDHNHMQDDAVGHCVYQRE